MPARNQRNDVYEVPKQQSRKNIKTRASVYNTKSVKNPKVLPKVQPRNLKKQTNTQKRSNQPDSIFPESTKKSTKLGLCTIIITIFLLSTSIWWFFLSKSHYNKLMTIKTAATGLGINIGPKVEYKYKYKKPPEDYILVETNISYTTLLLHQFDYITVNSCTQKSYIHRYLTSLDFSSSEASYDFEACEYMVNFAKENGLKFRAHNLLWMQYTTYPGFLNGVSELEVENYLLDYMRVLLKFHSFLGFLSVL